MIRRFILPLLVLLPACSDVDELPTQPVVPVPTFALSGTIRDIEGSSITAANVDVTASQYAGKQSLSDGEGNFSITGIAGSLTLRVWKEGYEAIFLPLVVTSDTTVEVTLPRFEFADSLVLGQAIRAYVSASAAPCDPERWDSQAPCRVFRFLAPVSGRLDLTVSWRGGSALDVTLVTPDGEYIAYSNEAAPETAALQAFVMEGSLYEIRINSYYDYQQFDLFADLTPESMRAAKGRLPAGALQRAR